MSKALLFLMFCCYLATGFAQVDPRYDLITDQQYRELSRWIFGYERPPSQKWGNKNCRLYGAVNNCRDPTLTCLHTGVDFSGSEGKTQVHSVSSGKVLKVEKGCRSCTMSCLSWVAIYNASVDVTFFYLHLEDIYVHEGQEVSPDQVIGTVGKRGYVTGAHLHFEARRGRKTHASLCISNTVNPYEAARKARSTISPTRVTSTVLVMDVSGSMSWQWRGGIKIESARKAALQFIEQVANEPRPPGSTHMIGVVTFSRDAKVVCPLTSNYQEAKDTVIKLGTLTSTNLGAGLDSALQELEKVPSARRFIILLSDGMTNTGKTRDQILSSSVAAARRQGICIHTVGFGDPGDIDEEFLQRIAADSGCGSYNYAASGFELFGTYVKIRHRMLGSNRVVEFSSGPSPVRLLARQSVSLGAFQLTAPARELHYTLTWSAPGRMRAILVDPSNRTVTTRYPGAMVYYGDGFMHITVLSPKQGIWKVSAVAITPFIQGVQYYGVASARTGGVVIPYRVPIPCIEILGTEICIPMPDLPTVLVVGIAIAAAAIVLCLQLAGK